MKMCCDCKELDDSKAKEGKSTGKLYYCKKQKKFVNACSEKCDKYKSDSKRSDSTKKELIRDGKLFDDSAFSAEFYGIVFLMLIILGLILGVF